MRTTPVSEGAEPGASRGPANRPKAARLHLWLIEPVASPTDSRWQDRPIWCRVVVAAPSAAFARLVAEEWATPRSRPQVGNESPSLCAGFADEKLYRVRHASPDFDPGQPSPTWPGRVIEADLLRDAPELP